MSCPGSVTCNELHTSKVQWLGSHREGRCCHPNRKNERRKRHNRTPKNSKQKKAKSIAFNFENNLLVAPMDTLWEVVSPRLCGALSMAPLWKLCCISQDLESCASGSEAGLLLLSLQSGCFEDILTYMASGSSPLVEFPVTS